MPHFKNAVAVMVNSINESHDRQLPANADANRMRRTSVGMVRSDTPIFNFVLRNYNGDHGRPGRDIRIRRRSR